MRGIYIRDPAFLKPELPAGTRNVHDSSVYESMRNPGDVDVQECIRVDAQDAVAAAQR